MGEETQPIAGLHRDIEELPHAELLTALHENHDEQHLWDCIVGKQCTNDVKCCKICDKLQKETDRRVIRRVKYNGALE